MELVLQHRRELADCVAAHGRAAPDEHGRAVVEWDTSLDGHLRDVVVKDAPGPLADCLVATVSTWKTRAHAVPSPRFSLPVKF
jgi:hypothetical protein